MMENGIPCVLVVEHGQEWRPMLCVDNWDSAAKVWRYRLYIHVIELLLQSPGAKKGGGTAPTAIMPLYFMFSDTSCNGGESNIGECNIHTNSTCSDSNSRAGWVKCQPGKSIHFCISKLIPVLYS